jgi:hypothetical protein
MPGTSQYLHAFGTTFESRALLSAEKPLFCNEHSSQIAARTETDDAAPKAKRLQTKHASSNPNSQGYDSRLLIEESSFLFTADTHALKYDVPEWSERRLAKAVRLIAGMRSSPSSSHR